MVQTSKVIFWLKTLNFLISKVIFEVISAAVKPTSQRWEKMLFLLFHRDRSSYISFY